MKKIYAFAAVAAVLGLASCSSSDDLGNNGNAGSKSTISLGTRATTMSLLSNDGAIDLTTVEAPVTYKYVDNLGADALKEGMETALKVLPEEKANWKEATKVEGVTDWATNYLYESQGDTVTLYPVYTQTGTEDYIGVFYYDEKNVKHEIDVFNNKKNHEGTWIGAYASTMEKYQALQIYIAKGYKYGFYLKRADAKDGKGQFYSQVSLNKTACSIGDQWNECKTKGIHSATFSYNGRTYVGFEDWESAGENGASQYDLNDVVFMTNKTLTVVPEPVVPDPVDPTPEDTTDVTPNYGSVEVNLGVAAEAKDGQIEGHISIHVRDTTDFEIFMPVAAEYYCQQDDMMIVQKHDQAFNYNEKNEEMSATVNGQTVKLYVTYAANGITIKSEGVNAAILKYLREVYNDGLTFEVRNYYNGLDHAALVAALNNSTVKFTSNPSFYVQAVGRYKQVLDANPIWVKLADSAASAYGNMWKEANTQDGVDNQSYIKLFKRTDVTVKETEEK